MKRLAVAALALFALPALADEGMWTFNNFPSQKVKEKYGFAPSQEWLDQVRLASARLAGGCSASFVSDSGLVMTNHHCARGCIQQLSSRARDYMRNGFYAKTLAEEKKCPAVEVNQLLEITDVTDRVRKATHGLSGAAFEKAEKAARAELEKTCGKDHAQIRCDLVRLYQGGLYHLYKYRRYQDTRLVFAPENQIGMFGGDPDNFEFPRYNLDVTFLRVYEGGKPAKTDHYFKWSADGAEAGELVFMSGNPGKTSRLDTIDELTYARDHSLPERLVYLAELRGMLNQFKKRGPEQERISSNALLGVENVLKALTGRRRALVDDAFFAQLVAQERSLREKVNADPKLKAQYGQAWAEIARAIVALEQIRERFTILESSAGAGSDLFKIARTLNRGAIELPKPNAERLSEYADARLKFLELNLFSPAPIYPDLETERLAFYLTKLREHLGPDDPVVQKVLGKQSPEAVAARAVRGTKLRDPKVRQRLWTGGQKALDAAKDPMIELVRSVDEAALAIRKRYEEDIESVLKRNDELIARARFQLYGTNTYPDATFSPRLTYGAIEGWSENGKQIPPFTKIDGTFERATGHAPFDLPPSWLRAKPKLDGQKPMNFASTNDIIGGNSGSPVINKNAEIVGIVFDGNIHSLGGEYGFDPRTNRAVSVDSRAIIESLQKVYNAQRLLKELQPTAAAGQTGSR